MRDLARFTFFDCHKDLMWLASLGIDLSRDFPISAIFDWKNTNISLSGFHHCANDLMRKLHFESTHLYSGIDDAVAELRAYLANVALKDPVTGAQRFPRDALWLDDHGKILEPIQSATDAPDVAGLPISADEDRQSKEITKEPSHATPNPSPGKPAPPARWSSIVAADLSHLSNPIFPRREVAAANQADAIMAVPHGVQPVKVARLTNTVQARSGGRSTRASAPPIVHATQDIPGDDDKFETVIYKKRAEGPRCH
jgi:hypothetical protein